MTWSFKLPSLLATFVLVVLTQFSQGKAHQWFTALLCATCFSKSSFDQKHVAFNFLSLGLSKVEGAGGIMSELLCAVGGAEMAPFDKNSCQTLCEFSRSSLSLSLSSVMSALCED